MRASARDCDDGWYEVTYCVEAIGRYVLRAFVNGKALGGSPTKLMITGGRTCPPACVRQRAFTVAA